MLARSDWPADYEEVFWDAFPRRIAKKDAMKVLYRIRKSDEVPFEILISAVKNFARTMVGKDMKFVPYPATWLNAGRWDDDPSALLDGKVKAVLALAGGKVLIRQGSPQALAWEKHRGKPFPWGQSGTWAVDKEFPDEQSC